MTQMRPQADWAQLSSELWMDIFSRLKLDSNDYGILTVLDLSQEFQDFIELATVCRKFEYVLKHGPNLHSVMYMKPVYDDPDLPGMFKWMQLYGKSVQRLVARCGSPYIESALGALLSHQHVVGTADLTSVYLSPGANGPYERLHDSVLVLLTKFSCLTACTLDMDSLFAGPQQYEFNLCALEALPHLVRLELCNGKFVGLDYALHLTYLDLQTSQVECYGDCEFATSLVELHLVDMVRLENFHSQGVCACCSLQELECVQSCVLAGTPTESLSSLKDQEHHIPDSLSQLTSLTRFDFFHVNHGAQLQFGWLSQLPSLQDIRMTIDVKTAEFPPALSLLSKLTTLKIANRVPGSHIRFAFDWGRLVELRVLETHAQVRFTQTLGQLTCLARLNRVVLSHIGDSDEVTTTQIGLLAHRLGIERPDVEFVMKPKRLPGPAA